MGKLEYVIRWAITYLSACSKKLKPLMHRISKQEAIQNVKAYETGKAEQLDSRLRSSWMHFEFRYRSSSQYMDSKRSIDLVLRNAGMMRNAVHMLRSKKSNELTVPQALALKVWSAKRHKQYGVANGTLLEGEAALEDSQRPDTSSVNSTGCGERLTYGPSNHEQFSSVCSGKKCWSPPPLSPSESEGDNPQSAITPVHASAPTSPIRLSHSLPASITPKAKEQPQKRTYSAAKEAHSATTARKREPELAVLNASFTDELLRRSASVVGYFYIKFNQHAKSHTGNHRAFARQDQAGA